MKHNSKQHTESKKRGRWSTREREKGARIGGALTDAVNERLLDGVKRYLRTGGKQTLQDAYHWNLRRHFSDGFKTINGVAVTVLLSEDKLPTYRQFRYIYEKHLLRKHV